MTPSEPPEQTPPEPPEDEDESEDLSQEILDLLAKGEPPAVRAAAGEGDDTALYGREGCPARVPADTPCPICGELHRD